MKNLGIWSLAVELAFYVIMCGLFLLLLLSSVSCTVQFDAATGEPVFGFNPTPEDLRVINDALRGGGK